MIDTHIHGDSRSSEDFEKMYLGGINKAISCGFYPYKVNNEMILLNHLNRILHYETKRAMEYGLDLKAALGIHPTNIISKPKLIYENIYEWIENKNIVAIGEIGLEKANNDEINIFKEQLNIGDETKTKVIVHTPRKNKEEILKIIKQTVLENIDPKLVVIDHVNQSIVDNIIDDDFTLGLTVQPKKMEVKEAIDILEKYGFNKFLLNSDISTKPSDPLSVPKTIRTLEKLGFNNKKIKKIAFKNAEKFFRI